MGRRLKVGVVGCGSAGPAAALFLARDGHDVTLFERAPALEPVGTGFLLQPTGLHVLEQLGLRGRAEAHGAPVERLLSRTTGGRALLDLPYARLGPGIHGLGMHRATLLRILVEALEAEGVPVRCGAEVSAMPAEGGRRWLVEGEARHGPFDLVIVANGARSALRAEAGVRQRARPYPWGALWTIAADPERRFAGRLHQVVDGTRTMVGFLDTGTRIDDPSAAPLVSIFWSTRADRVAALLAEGPERLAASIRARVPEAEAVLARVGRMEQWSFAGYMDVVMARWHGPGCVVLGDAGHAMSPQLGQGVNLALFDAWVLARCIAREPDLPRALARYTRERRPHLGFYQRATRWLTPLFQSSIPGLGALRDLAFPLAGRIPALRTQMLRSMAGSKRGVLRRSLDLEAHVRTEAERIAATP